MTVLHSQEDASINIIENGFESRFVQRSEDYFIIYLSSQKGCAQHCRMCHLTATGQTNTAFASKREFLEQMLHVFEEIKHKDLSKIRKVHVNFMARGEPLTNPAITQQWGDLSKILADSVRAFFLRTGNRKFGDVIPEVQFIISTIVPYDIPTSRPVRNTSEQDSINLDPIGKAYALAIMQFAQAEHSPRIYYSLYSVNPNVRKKWLPRAMGYEYGLLLLSTYQNLLTLANKSVKNKIHHAFIKGVNDTDYEAHRLMTVLDKPEFHSIKKIPFNIVRYNPYDERYGEESEESRIERVTDIYHSYGHEVSIIPRVGHDVKASCGMFVENTL